MSTLDRLTALAARGRALGRPAAGPAAAASTGAAAAPWYRISNAGGDRAAVYLYDFIDPWGINAADFVTELRGITAPAIDLHINSGGGLVFDAIAIYSALKNHPAAVDVSIDGLAASAASFVAMAGDTVTIEKPAKIMIHDAAVLVYGNAADMHAAAVLLDELSDTIAAIYADRAGGPADTWRAAMRAETWYGAAAAVDAGLADRVANDTTAAPEDRRSQTIRARARVAALGRVA
jgi:ATP-dependent protease ClpP protease subunit